MSLVEEMMLWDWPDTMRSAWRRLAVWGLVM